MTKEIQWEWASPPARRSDVERIEERFGVKLPDDYVKCALVNHGGYASRIALDFGGEKEKCFESLLALKKEKDEEDVYSVEEAFEDVEDRLPKGVIPFGADPFGNLYCFDYRKDSPPTLVYWDHEKAEFEPGKSITYVADSFTELLSMLYQPEDIEMDEEDEEG